MPDCDQRSMMRPIQPPNLPIPCPFAGTEKLFPPLSDNELKDTIPNVIISLIAARHDFHLSPDHFLSGFPIIKRIIVPTVFLTFFNKSPPITNFEYASFSCRLSAVQKFFSVSLRLPPHSRLLSRERGGQGVSAPRGRAVSLLTSPFRN